MSEAVKNVLLVLGIVAAATLSMVITNEVSADTAVVGQPTLEPALMQWSADGKEAMVCRLRPMSITPPEPWVALQCIPWDFTNERPVMFNNRTGDMVIDGTET